MFETIDKLYLYLAMIPDSYHNPVIANNVLVFVVELRQYSRS
jgi:hypothetical protein